jgi:hypothetical protein
MIATSFEVIAGGTIRAPSNGIVISAGALEMRLLPFAILAVFGDRGRRATS